jgi:hypothetical protein
VVGIDLIVWLYFLFTVITAALLVISLQNWGSDGTIGDLSSSNGYNGEYILTDKNSWAYNVTHWYATGPSTSTWDADLGKWITEEYKPKLEDVVRNCTPEFSSCADQDAWVNNLWNARPTRLALDFVAVACMGVLCLLHFGLFVWGCVETHRRRQKKSENLARGVAMGIITDLERRGLVVLNREGVQGKMSGGPPVLAQMLRNEGGDDSFDF